MAEETKPEPVMLSFAPGQPASGDHPKTGKPLAPARSIELNNGSEYRRVFDAKDQPFKAEPIEEAPFLLRTGFFVVAEKPAEPAATDAPVAGSPAEMRATNRQRPGKAASSTESQT